MKKLVVVVVALLALSAALLPHELAATKTVGHQARVDRLRRIESPQPPSELPVCTEGRISTDRDPCMGADGRLDYQPGR